LIRFNTSISHAGIRRRGRLCHENLYLRQAFFLSCVSHPGGVYRAAPNNQCSSLRFPFHYSGDGSAATEELGEYQMNWWIDAVVKAIRAVKADDVSLKLQNEFYEKTSHRWTRNRKLERDAREEACQ